MSHSIEIIQGDLLGVGAPKAIAHGCNAQGVMGAGIAAQIRARFPQCFETYRKRCQHGTYVLGDVEHWSGSQDGEKYDVFNCCTQVKPGRDARIVAIETALCRTLSIAREHGIAVLGMPKIGCGLGGLNWNVVLPVLQRIAADTPVQIFVYEYDPRGQP